MYIIIKWHLLNKLRFCNYWSQVILGCSVDGCLFDKEIIWQKISKSICNTAFSPSASWQPWCGTFVGCLSPLTVSYVRAIRITYTSGIIRTVIDFIGSVLVAFGGRQDLSGFGNRRRVSWKIACRIRNVRADSLRWMLLICFC